ncbi:MAG: hypothetical protein KGL46_12505 [Hyphomicrobiales bacterium]|nr:hypothetical protein [Hyphomicrobiales bacterium]
MRPFFFPVDFRIAVILSALLGAIAPAHAVEGFGRPLDRGGEIAEYMRAINEARGRPHVIAGDCMSACTLWLGYANACVEADAVLWFHGPADGLARFRGLSPWAALSESGAGAMLSMYPPRVRAVVADWLRSPQYRTLTGQELGRLGVPVCGAGRSAAR